MMKFTLPQATDRDRVFNVLRREGFTVRNDLNDATAIHTDASAADVAGAVVYAHAAQSAADHCPDDDWHPEEKD